MTLDPQTQQIANHILAAALQAETVEAGLNQIYAVIITWAEQASLDALYAYSLAALDQERSEDAQATVPSRDYLRQWSVAKLREAPVHALNQRLMERDYQPQPHPLPAGEQTSLSKGDISVYGQTLASSQSIQQALDFFEALLVRYASLVDAEKVRQALDSETQPEDWRAEDAFKAVFTLLYYTIIDLINAHGLWPVSSVDLEDIKWSGDYVPPVKKTPARPFYESDSPDVIFNRSLPPEVLRAYQEAGRALIHFRVVHQHGMFNTIGSGTVPELPGLLNDFERLSLSGDSAHWAQPVPGKWGSLRATSALLMAGTAAPGLLLGVHIDPLADTSPTGQTIRWLLNEDLDLLDYEHEEPDLHIMHLYEAVEKEVKAHWSAVERVAKRLLELGELPKAEAYQIFMGRG